MKMFIHTLRKYASLFGSAFSVKGGKFMQIVLTNDVYRLFIYARWTKTFAFADSQKVLDQNRIKLKLKMI